MQTVKGHVHKTSDTTCKAEHIAPALLMVSPQVEHYVDGNGDVDSTGSKIDTDSLAKMNPPDARMPDGSVDGSPDEGAPETADEAGEEAAADDDFNGGVITQDDNKALVYDDEIGSLVTENDNKGVKVRDDDEFDHDPGDVGSLVTEDDNKGVKVRDDDEFNHDPGETYSNTDTHHWDVWTTK